MKTSKENKNYYKIPIFEQNIKIDNISLKEILKQDYQSLYDLYDERISIIWERGDEGLTKKQNESLNQNKEKREKKAEKLFIPLYLLAIGTDHITYEASTFKELKSDYEATLSVRKITKEEFTKLYTRDYQVKVNKFINRKNIKLVVDNKNIEPSINIKPNLAIVKEESLIKKLVKTFSYKKK